MQYSNGSGVTSLRYAWRLMPLLAKSHDSILHVSNADHVMLQGSNRAVTLVLTRQAVLIVNVAEDSVEKIFPLKDLIAADHPSELTMFRLYTSNTSPPQPFRKMSPVEQVEVHVRILFVFSIVEKVVYHCCSQTKLCVLWKPIIMAYAYFFP